MRIIAGGFKNRVIHAPHDKSLDPTSDRVRQALFNILGNQIVGARFADLFAGSGAVGLEALSRGAERVTFIENRRPTAEAIRATLASLAVGPERARVWHSDVFKLEDNPSEWSEWDIAFLDPPGSVKDNFLDVLLERDILAAGSLIIVERPVDRCPTLRPEMIRLLDQRTYGKTSLFFYAGSFSDGD